MPSETDARIVIDRLLREAGWDIEDKSQVSTEEASLDGRADYLLKNNRSQPLVVIEAKRFPASLIEILDPSIRTKLTTESAKLEMLPFPEKSATVVDALRTYYAFIKADKARVLSAGEDLALELENTVYALDSTTIDLSLSLFPWAAWCSHTRKLL